MSDPAIRVPSSLPGDSSDVATALEVCGALWQKGSREEAIRWLKRAVEAASEAGDGDRADALMTAVVQLEHASEEPAAEAVEPGPAPAPVASAAPAAPPAAAASSMPPRPPPAARVSKGPAPVAPASAAPARAPTAPPAAASASSRPSPSSPATAPSMSPRPPAVVTKPSPAAYPVAGQHIRVSVKASVRDPNLFIVRPLLEGRPAPPGTREASLVLTEEDPAAHAHGANGSSAS